MSLPVELAAGFLGSMFGGEFVFAVDRDLVRSRKTLLRVTLGFGPSRGRTESAAHW